MVKNGVVFCNDIDKGLVLTTLINRLPARVCLIDDKEKNLHDMARAVNALTGVKYIGYHYTAASTLTDNKVDPIVVAKQLAAVLGPIPAVLADEDAL